MAVKYYRTNASVVVLAQGVDLSQLNPILLEKAGILKDSEFGSNSIFTSSLVQISGNNFILTAMVDRIQIKFNTFDDDVNRSILLRVLGGIILKKPDFQYQALGFNIDHIVAPEKENFGDWNERLFRSSVFLGQKLSGVYYGAYISRSSSIPDMRDRIDIKPVVVKKSGEIPVVFSELFPDASDAVHVNYNFHADGVQEKLSLPRVNALLSEWSKAAMTSKNFVEGLI
jgi:hypothetical protein